MLGKNIKDLRLYRGLSQSQLAKEIGVTQGAIFFWEKGINEPTAGYLVKLAKFFQVSVDDLLSFDSETERVNASKFSEITLLFSKLSESQQKLVTDTVKELLKEKG